MYHFAAADLWQHLAALNAIIENPLHPSNPFVDSDRPSRLFGPYWVLVGGVSSLAGLTAPQGFVLGSILNLILLAIGISDTGSRHSWRAERCPCPDGGDAGRLAARAQFHRLP